MTKLPIGTGPATFMALSGARLKTAPSIASSRVLQGTEFPISAGTPAGRSLKARSARQPCGVS
jgi:hypothetical protein